MELLHRELTDKILGAYFEVYNKLGYGFLEKVYENALAEELNLQGFRCVCQHPIDVFYKGKRVGEYFADLVVEGKVIVELKASKTLQEVHEYQLINYLKATKIEVELLLDFGKAPEFKRKVFSNESEQKRD